MSGNLLAPLQLDCAMWSLCSHPCFRTPRGNPAQLGHNHILAIDAIQSNRQNHLGLRRIWWFLLCNFRPVSHLYLQLDTSGNPPLMSPVSKRTRFFHIVSSNFPRYYRSALWNNWKEPFQMEIHQAPPSTSAPKQFVFAAADEKCNVALHGFAIWENQKLPPILTETLVTLHFKFWS